MKRLRPSFIAVLVMLAAAALPAQTLTVTAPGAGAVVCRGRSFTITWTASGAMDDRVKIRLWQGAARVLNIVDRTENDGAYTWDVPAGVAEGAGYTIRVLTVDEAVSDGSDPFSISSCAAAIAVSEPMETGAYRVRGAAPVPIAWTSSGISGDVRIDLERWEGAGSYVIRASHPCGGSPISYPVPDGVAAGTYRVKVSQGAVVGYSGRIAILAYAEPRLSLVRPNGGEVLTQGGTYAIEWEAVNLDGNVRIELLRRGAVAAVLAESHPILAGFFTWRGILAPAGGPKPMLGGDFKISMRTTDRRFHDVSDAAFSIRAAPGVWLFQPAAGAVWDEDSLREIRWNAQGLEGRTVTIILKFTSGSPLNIRAIARGVPAMDKRYSWTVMDLETGPWNLAAGTYPDAVISLVTEGDGVRCSSASKEFTIRKR